MATYTRSKYKNISRTRAATHNRDKIQQKNIFLWIMIRLFLMYFKIMHYNVPSKRVLFKQVAWAKMPIVYASRQGNSLTIYSYMFWVEANCGLDLLFYYSCIYDVICVLNLKNYLLHSIRSLISNSIFAWRILLFLYVYTEADL